MTSFGTVDCPSRRLSRACSRQYTGRRNFRDFSTVRGSLRSSLSAPPAAVLASPERLNARPLSVPPASLGEPARLGGNGRGRPLDPSRTTQAREPSERAQRVPDGEPSEARRTQSSGRGLPGGSARPEQQLRELSKFLRVITFPAESIRAYLDQYRAGSLICPRTRVPRRRRTRRFPPSCRRYRADARRPAPRPRGRRRCRRGQRASRA